jgi:hypothetical protein
MNASHRVLDPAAALVILACSAPDALGQPAPPAEPSTWSFSAAVYTYWLPDEDNYAQPTVTAERGRLHLEARYNYEERETGSVWVGYTFSGGEALVWEVKPLVGGVFGVIDGIAPGYKASVGWRMLEGYSEGEYVFDAGELTDSFFYNWSEVTLAPVEWLRGGLVTQRTRAYNADHDIQRGFLVGASYRPLDVTTYVFYPDDSKPTVVLAVALSW